jgi:hypothetical protein
MPRGFVQHRLFSKRHHCRFPPLLHGVFRGVSRGVLRGTLYLDYYHIALGTGISGVHIGIPTNIYSQLYIFHTHDLAYLPIYTPSYMYSIHTTHKACTVGCPNIPHSWTIAGIRVSKIHQCTMSLVQVFIYIFREVIREHVLPTVIFPTHNQ